jgi:hypothetical protein
VLFGRARICLWLFLASGTIPQLTRRVNRSPGQWMIEASATRQEWDIYCAMNEAIEIALSAS